MRTLMFGIMLSLCTLAARADEPAKVAAPAAPAAAPAPPSSEDALVTDPGKATFKPATLAGLPKGVENALLGVDPKSGGPIAYAKIPAGATIPMHTHTHSEYTVLLAGKARLTLDGKPHNVAPGSYVVIPGKSPHELTCEAGAECLLLTRRAGPVDYSFVK